MTPPPSYRPEGKHARLADEAEGERVIWDGGGPGSHEAGCVCRAFCEQARDSTTAVVQNFTADLR